MTTNEQVANEIYNKAIKYGRVDDFFLMVVQEILDKHYVDPLKKALCNGGKVYHELDKNQFLDV